MVLAENMAKCLSSVKHTTKQLIIIIIIIIIIIKDIIESLLNADSIDNEKFLNFVTERLIKGAKGFFEQIVKLPIALGMKSKKETPKAISVLKEHRQAFDVVLVDEIDLS